MGDKLKSLINQVLKQNDQEKVNYLDSSMSLRDDIGLTSFDLATLTVLIEDEYGIDIFENGLVSTVGEIREKLDK
jgi:acyl carrier protein